ncbi:MAG: sigma-54-dependent transcriptional regulator, partial [Rhodothalassiaceae bacterium]
MPDKPKLLLVEDSRTLAETYEAYLASLDVRTTRAESLAAARTAVAEDGYDVILLDVKLPDGDGLDLLDVLPRGDEMPRIIVMTAHGSIAVAVAAMRAGAADFIVKPFDKARLLTTVRNALEYRRLTRLVHRYEQSFRHEGYGEFLGSSPAMQAVYRMIDNAAPSRASVFITGESGTGKELCARALHQRSPRRDAPFVALNCAALPKELIESEIFGHRQGAFTGATSNREGAAVRADRGTLFLDEICEMDLALQGKLLRFLQTGMVQPVGADEARPVDVRILCATNRDPQEEVSAGRFREDLFYRL